MMTKTYIFILFSFLLLLNRSITFVSSTRISNQLVFDSCKQFAVVWYPENCWLEEYYFEGSLIAHGRYADSIVLNCNISSLTAINWWNKGNIDAMTEIGIEWSPEASILSVNCQRMVDFLEIPKNEKFGDDGDLIDFKVFLSLLPITEQIPLTIADQYIQDRGTFESQLFHWFYSFLYDKNVVIDQFCLNAVVTAFEPRLLKCLTQMIGIFSPTIDTLTISNILHPRSTNILQAGYRFIRDELLSLLNLCGGTVEYVVIDFFDEIVFEILSKVNLEKIKYIDIKDCRLTSPTKYFYAATNSPLKSLVKILEGCSGHNLETLKISGTLCDKQVLSSLFQNISFNSKFKYLKLDWIKRFNIRSGGYTETLDKLIIGKSLSTSSVTGYLEGSKEKNNLKWIDLQLFCKSSYLNFRKRNMAVHEKLGSGTYGHVLKASVPIPNQRDCQTVAVKLFKDFDEGIHEISMYVKLFDEFNHSIHPNLIKPIGFAIDTLPKKILNFIESDETYLRYRSLSASSSLSVEYSSSYTNSSTTSRDEDCDNPKTQSFSLTDDEDDTSNSSSSYDYNSSSSSETDSSTASFVFIVMEYHENSQDLCSFLQDHRGPNPFLVRPLKISLIANISRQILSGLEYLHSKSIVHNDLKLTNILIQKVGNNCDDDVKIFLIDFGLSAEVQPGHWATRRQGTYSILSPESIKGKYNHLTDIWSFGVILHQLITFEDPFTVNDSDYNNPMYLTSDGLSESGQKGYDSFNDPASKILAKKILTNSRNFGKLRYSLLISQCPELFDFVNRCLAVSLTRRWNASQLLNHPFLLKYAQINRFSK